jgi:hypothetical protein
MFYQVNGNAATNLQFYATDSTQAFCSKFLISTLSLILILLCQQRVTLKNDMQRLLNFKMEVLL